jgi:hypothetical protein
VIDCCKREIVGWNLSHRCRTEEGLAAVEQAVLDQMPAGSREKISFSRGYLFARSLAITDPRTPRTSYHHPEGKSYIDRPHRGVENPHSRHDRLGKLKTKP